ncbi:MAG: hypothetical protein M3077_08075 [Candidatus Dormibacteraeota bacterium]|nr:hypothetical protein [Candidatus Dormibacteraeota bacterium]MDQ6884175.1 hypothetical protein [Candidatus Dormibacteraeota bacterium]
MRSAIQQLVVAMTALALVGCGGSLASSTGHQPASGACPVSSQAPNYGFGSGPVYLSGQNDWYSGGQVAVLLVDASYSGPLLIRASPLAGDGASTITLAEENLSTTAVAGLAAKEQQHSRQLVSATRLAGGELRLAAGEPSSSSREWFGYLSTSGPGCFAVQADGDTFSEVITFSVRPGPAPPG